MTLVITKNAESKPVRKVEAALFYLRQSFAVHYAHYLSKKLKPEIFHHIICLENHITNPEIEDGRDRFLGQNDSLSVCKGQWQSTRLHHVGNISRYVV